MRDRTLRKLATWLCLVATILLGVSPGQGWVLCLEPDGRVAFELATESGGCGGCPDGAGDSREGALPISEPADCPCIDIPLVLGSEQDQLELKRIELPVSQAAMLPVAVVLAFEPAASTFQARPPDTLLPAQSLASIRSVVLLV